MDELKDFSAEEENRKPLSHAAFIAVRQHQDHISTIARAEEMVENMRAQEVQLLHDLDDMMTERERRKERIRAQQKEANEERESVILQVMQAIRPIGYSEAELRSAATRIVEGDYDLFSSLLQQIRESKPNVIDTRIERIVSDPDLVKAEFLRPFEQIRIHRTLTALAHLEEADDIPDSFFQNASTDRLERHKFSHPLWFREQISQDLLPSSAKAAIDLLHRVPERQKTSNVPKDIVARIRDLSSHAKAEIASNTGIKENEKWEMHQAQIRYLIRRDMPEVAAIERGTFDEELTWTEEDFLTALRQRNCIGLVAEENEEIIGFMIYELYTKMIHLMNFAIREDHRRKGIGESLIILLNDKMNVKQKDEAKARREWMQMSIPERCNVGQLHLSSLGFSPKRDLSVHTSKNRESEGNDGVKMFIPKKQIIVPKSKTSRDWLRMTDAFLETAA